MVEAPAKPIVTKELIGQIFMRSDGKPEISSHLLKTDIQGLAFQLARILAGLINLIPKAERSAIVKPNIVMEFESGKQN